MSEEINVKIGLEVHVPEPFSFFQRKKNVHETRATKSLRPRRQSLLREERRIYYD